jgi:hypothetical protein
MVIEQHAGNRCVLRECATAAGPPQGTFVP